MDFRFGELFSGPGGLALGAKLARIIVQGEPYSISMSGLQTMTKIPVKHTA